MGVDLNALVVAPLLIEHHLGDWQGLTRAEIDAQYPGARQTREASKWDYVVPGGESYVLVAARARQWLGSKRHAAITVAVTHEMISRTIQGAYAALTPGETFARSHRHDRIYRLHAGRIEEMLGQAQLYLGCEQPLPHERPRRPRLTAHWIGPLTRIRSPRPLNAIVDDMTSTVKGHGDARMGGDPGNVAVPKRSDG